MTGSITRVAIVTPVHNRRDITLQCLRSLERISKHNVEVSTFVVDDGSTDGTAEAIASEFPQVTVIPADGSLFFTEGTNVGIRAALEENPDFVLLMNDDQVFDSNFLEYLVETAEKYPRSVVGPLLLLWDVPHKIFQISPRWETLSGGWRHWQRQTVWTVPGSPWEVDLIVGNCLLVPASAFREAGLMNSKRYPNFGDAEFTPRLRKLGWKLLIDPRSRVFCQPNNLPASISKMTLAEKWDALVVNLKHGHNLRRRFYSYWDGAPTRLQGACAFAVFVARIALGMNTEKAQAEGYSEEPLSKIFQSRIVR
jgi:GT2 family glycosyltransferase